MSDLTAGEMGLRSWLLAADRASRPQGRLGQGYRAWRVFIRNPLAVMGLALIGLLLGVAAFAPLIAPYSPIDQDLVGRLVPPSARHWFGTDELGRDIYSRLIWGARITLLIVSLGTVLVAPVGLLLGCV